MSRISGKANLERCYTEHGKGSKFDQVFSEQNALLMNEKFRDKQHSDGQGTIIRPDIWSKPKTAPAAQMAADWSMAN
eukprot:3092204-Heterocapsa_arctica.AAC.1